MRSVWTCALLVLCLALPAPAHNGKLAAALPVAGLRVDGDGADWPAKLPRYAIATPEYGDPAAGPADCRAEFRIGYDAALSALFVLVEVEDDSWVREPDASVSWQTQDGCEVYLDVTHAAETAPALQYYTFGGGPGRTAMRSEGVPGVAAAWRHSAGTHTYEWRLDLGRAGVVSGDVISFDVVVADRDADGSFTWYAWGRGVQKMIHAGRRGDVLLVGPDVALGSVGGVVVKVDGRPAGQARVRIAAVEEPRRWVWVETDGDGVFAAMLPAGTYVVLRAGRRPGEESERCTVLPGKATTVRLVMPPVGGQARQAGPGRRVRAGPGRQTGLWRRFTFLDGLARGRVLALLEDADGALWIGTDSGLCRFDGVWFTTYGTADGLPVVQVLALAPDAAGGLWLGTRVGLVHYDGREFVTYSQADGLPDDMVKALCPEPGGDLWVGTESGLCRFDGSYFQIYGSRAGLPSSSVSSLARDSQGTLWVGTQGGGCRRSGSSSRRSDTGPTRCPPRDRPQAPGTRP